MKKSFLFVALLALAFGFTACNDDAPEEGNARLSIKLTDAPADYEEVWIDIVDIQVKSTTEEGENGWTSLDNVQAGQYDLLKLTAGVDTLLTEVDLPAGRIGQIRLILGSENYVTIDGEQIRLTTPSAHQSGLKLLVNETLEAGRVYEFLLDFDAARSVVKAGNSGQYILKPTIKVITSISEEAVISGAIDPADLQAVVYGIIDEDTVSAYPNAGGIYYLRGLEAPATYRVVIVPAEETGFEAVTIEGVETEVGEITTVETVAFGNE
ncbi:DUF4382 domain-containing protein [Penaeicola halotolerans]|uniref:DUF4382 domain-containing protein n=1 Tax=Penaeicola halotolerans TaxID=2793196 RepID=UPI001CF89658|nr:DUF4382 domain-containing protein [Penaeicola halotolerans]